MYIVKFHLLQSAIFFVAWMIVGDCLRKEKFLKERRVSILSDSEELEGPTMAAQQSAIENCVCVFHYMCDRYYNLITNGAGIIDERIGPDDPPAPPETQCPSPGQICCRVPNGTEIPSTLPPQISSGPPITTARPTTLSPPAATTASPATTTAVAVTTGGAASGTTPRQGNDNPSITLPPGTVIILPTSSPPVATTVAPATTSAPPATTATPPATTAAPAATTAAPPTTTPTPRPQTVPTAPPTGPPPTTPTPATTQGPAPPSSGPPENTTAAVTTAASDSTAAQTTAAATISTAAQETTAGTGTPPLVIPTRPPPLPSTPPPQTIPTVPPPSATTTSIAPPTTPTTAGPTSPATLPTNPSVIFPNTTTSLPATNQPPVVFPTSAAPETTAEMPGTSVPPVVFPTTPNGAGTTAPPATTAKPATTAAPATTTLGPPGSQCGVRYIEPGRIETVEPYATSFGEFPWMLAVLDSTAITLDGTVVRNAFVAGASLITKNIALTGAHRVRNFTSNPSTLIVRAGEWNTVTANEPLPHQDRTVQRIEIHSDFNRTTLANDIALMKFEEVVFANNVVPICLPDLNQQFSGSCVATGWGQNAFGPKGQFQRIMRKVSLPVVDRAICQTQLRDTRLGFGFVLDSSFMCAGGQPNLDTCTGDGGGPLVCTTPRGYVQTGIVSWGIGCGMANVPGVYVDVGVFRGWIDSATQVLSRDTVPRFTRERE